MGDSIDKAILNALRVNMGHACGEPVAIVMQEWAPHLGEEERAAIAASQELCLRMERVYREAGVDVTLLAYVPSKPMHGVDASPGLYSALDERRMVWDRATCELDWFAGYPVVFMPTAYSLTHTGVRARQTEKGSRVASMPTFTLDMFKKGGPMDADYLELELRTREVATSLRSSEYVRVTAEGTDMVTQVDRTLVHESSGVLASPGKWGNLPGAEGYAVPRHLGDSNGHFTVPEGWGGKFPLEHAAVFTIENGRFKEVRPARPSRTAQAYIDEKVFPSVFGGKNHEVYAELGIGVNANITPQTVARDGWSILTAEKIDGSAHFANGKSSGMGGANDVPVHIDWVVPDVEIEYRYAPR